MSRSDIENADFNDTGYSYTLSLIAGKSKPVILYCLMKYKPVRFSQTRRYLGNIADKTLSRALKELEADELVERTVYPEIPPKVEYSLTPRGVSLVKVLDGLCVWRSENRPTARARRQGQLRPKRLVRICSPFSEEFLALSRRGGHTIGPGNHSNHWEAHPFALGRSSVRVGLFRRNLLHPREMRHQDNRFRPATALRTCVVLVFAWAMAALAGPLSAIGEMSGILAVPRADRADHRRHIPHDREEAARARRAEPLMACLGHRSHCVRRSAFGLAFIMLDVAAMA